MYLLQHPEAIGVTLRHPFVLAFLLLLPILLYRHHGAGPWAQRLRAAAFVCVVGALAGLQLTARLPDERLTLVAAVDLSESVGDQGQEWSQRYLSTVSKSLAPGDEMAVLTFAGDVAVINPPGKPGTVDRLVAPKTLSATDIARAIDAAVALLPHDGERRLLLLTDGNETRGDARRSVALLRSARIPIDVAVPPRNNQFDVAVDKLIAPAIVTEGNIFPIQIVALNTGAARPLVRNLFVDGKIVDSAAITLAPGTTRLEVPFRLKDRGSHRLRAELVADNDSVSGNNFREVPITVARKTRVLFVTPHDQSLLASLLERRGIEVNVIAPRALPKTIEGLLGYHCVIFEEITGAGIHAPRLDVLERYTREYGGGFVLVGGARTFGDVRLKRTALQRLLPVTLESWRPIPNSREPLALFILIDRSNSMGYNSRIRNLRDGEKLRYAKRAALAVVRQLRDQDLVGLTVFDSRRHEIAPLRHLQENRQRLEADIPRLVESGGTDFYDALEGAREQLSKARVSRRHVVLLTDGDTNRAAADHYPLIARLAEEGISVTTIRIGDNDVNLRLLRDISQRTGGEFHYVRDVELLPDLMLRDTTQAFGPPSGGEQFLPEVGETSEILVEIEPSTVPALDGYAYSRPKPGADIVLRVARLDRHDPILAVWQYGLGRVAAFTASPLDDAERWPGWTAFGKFWSQLVHWTIKKETALDYAVEVTKRGGVHEITVRTFNPTGQVSALRARLHVTEDDVREISLAPRAPRVFGGHVTNVPGGRYPLTIMIRHAADDLREHTGSVTVPEAEEEPREESRAHAPNLALLTQLTDSTGGRLNPEPGTLDQRRPGTRSTQYRLDSFLLVLAMLLFLGDVAVRRIWGS